jgi:uncharacterized protein (TIGR03437 family)
VSHRLGFFTLCLLSGVCSGQTASAPAIASVGYTNPFPLAVAPGQLLTLYVQAPAASNASAVFWTQNSTEAMPVVRVSPSEAACFGPPNSAPPTTCANVFSVTVQVPFDIPTARPPLPVGPASIAISMNGVQSPYYGVQGQPTLIHILNTCDALVQGSAACAPLIMHANGQQVTAQLPATSGEELVAYATGLGQTNPPLTTGQPATESNPVILPVNLDFNFRADALAAEPGAGGATSFQPLFAGSTKGFVGLYQVNFTVPSPPAGLQPCPTAIPVAALAPTPIFDIIRSNLTVSFGSYASFDGAGICVTPGS